MLRNVDSTAWTKAIIEENVLQAGSPKTAIRIARLVRKRLELMKSDLWHLVRDETAAIAAHALLAAAVKHSPLLGDFMDLALREQYRIFSPAISNQTWDAYLDGCRARDPDMLAWRESTRKRLRSTVFQIIAQAGYIEDTRSRKLQTVRIAPEVLRYLEQNKEHYVLRCIQVAP